MRQQRKPTRAFADWREWCRDLAPVPFATFWRDNHMDYEKRKPRKRTPELQPH